MKKRDVEYLKPPQDSQNLIEKNIELAAKYQVSCNSVVKYKAEQINKWLKKDIPKIINNKLFHKRQSSHTLILKKEII